MPRRKESDSQSHLPFSRSPSRERTLEIYCDNCQARFVAWYGTEEEADTETIDVEKCGLCGGDSFKRDNFKDCTLRLVAQVTARGVKRGD
jgi:Zn finger protein HypA/HybF involved in hydrogenase expression